MNDVYIIQNGETTISNEVSYEVKSTDKYFIFEANSSLRRFQNIKDPYTPGFIQKVVNPWTYWDSTTKLKSIRLQRDFLIAQSDWRVIRATETQTPESQVWINYRQALRDFPNLVNVNLPIEQIVWPQQPS